MMLVELYSRTLQFGNKDLGYATCTNVVIQVLLRRTLQFGDKDIAAILIFIH